MTVTGYSDTSNAAGGPSNQKRRRKEEEGGGRRNEPQLESAKLSIHFHHFSFFQCWLSIPFGVLLSMAVSSSRNLSSQVQTTCKPSPTTSSHLLHHVASSYRINPKSWKIPVLFCSVTYEVENFIINAASNKHKPIRVIPTNMERFIAFNLLNNRSKNRRKPWKTTISYIRRRNFQIKR